MAELSVDPYVDLYARRTGGMSASEFRALFAVAARPEVVSLAGGMPYVEALPHEDVLEVVGSVLAERGATALQYGGGAGHPGLKERLAALMAEEGLDADPEQVVVTDGAQQALDLVAKILVDPGDQIVVEAPSYVGALSALSAYEPRFVRVRLGWALGAPGVIQRLVLVKEAADLCTSSFMQLVGEQYLSGERWRQNLTSLVDIYRRRRDVMLESLPQHFPADARWTTPNGGFYVWVSLPEYIDTQAL